MRIGNPLRSALLVSALLSAGVVLAQDSAHPATPLSDARITVENRARADGYIRLRMAPQGGTVVETTVDVLRRMSENEIAADIEKALTLIVPDGYEVNRGGGENVRIRKTDRDTVADFTLEIAFNTPGLRITIED